MIDSATTACRKALGASDVFPLDLTDKSCYRRVCS